MTRLQQAEHNQLVIQILINMVRQHRYLPAYKSVATYLNDKGLLTSRGNSWTPKRLFRMLQRNGFSGLWGLNRSIR